MENGTPMVPVIAISRFVDLVPFNLPNLIPRPKQIHVVIGKPIDIPRFRNEDIKKYRTLFVKELYDIFERYKGAEENCCRVRLLRDCSLSRSYSMPNYKLF